eukprot:TCONS_00031825-protein
MPFKGDTEKLLKIKKDGQKLHDDFKSQRLHSNSVPFNARLPKQKPTLFCESKRKPKQKKNKSAEVIKANSNVLGKLLTLSANAQQPIDFQQALSYPLYDVPLSLAFPDGTKRSNQKSKLLEIIENTKMIDKRLFFRVNHQ